MVEGQQNERGRYERDREEQHSQLRLVVLVVGFLLFVVLCLWSGGVQIRRPCEDERGTQSGGAKPLWDLVF